MYAYLLHILLPVFLLYFQKIVNFISFPHRVFSQFHLGLPGRGSRQNCKEVVARILMLNEPLQWDGLRASFDILAVLRPSS